MNKLKYLGYSIVFQEVPDEVTLAINISGCPHKCEGCHSKHLWEYNGNYVSDDLPKLLKKYEGMITCVCFMGGDQNLEELNHLVYLVKEAGLKAALYTGSSDAETIGYIICAMLFDYVKYGPYIEECGGLNKETTNQVMLKWEEDKWIDITYKFQKGHKNEKI